MPSLVEGTEPAGTLRAASRKPRTGRGLVAGGAGDNAASAAGLGVISPGQGFLSLGSSGVLFVVTDRFRPNADKAAHAFCHALPDRWHQMSVMLSAAAALDWAAALAGFADAPWRRWRPPRRRGSGAPRPCSCRTCRGSAPRITTRSPAGVFFGLSAGTTGADIIAAVFEGGRASRLPTAWTRFCRAAARYQPTSASSAALRGSITGSELIASSTGRTLTRRSGGESGAALGAARLARIAVTGEPTRGGMHHRPASTA